MYSESFEKSIGYLFRSYSIRILELKRLLLRIQDAGIKFEMTEESYTSKCSFLDLETIKHHEYYLGRQVSAACFDLRRGF